MKAIIKTDEIIINACKCGNIAVVASLAEGNSILNEIEQRGVSPLIVAAYHGQIGIVRYILQHDCYIIDPEILARSASVAKETGNEKIRSILTIYYIKYCRYSA
ncbi:MAG: hypothetical protein PHV12_06740 [Bacteroidales bacterium]|jgi:ankyrin repeat protein|nr:hypothetical protein [Bacteroidales bacterium]MDD3273482.1 hypothetical protein [Bacteroidales bacterium]MDD4058785.1 hypothetical protein [Bacteroidales bacterium]